MDSPIPESSILSPILLIVLAVNLVAAAWLGLRIYLHMYGTLTDGTVKEALVRSSRTSSDGFDSSTRMYTYTLKIQYTGSDGKKRMVKGSRYTSDDAVRKTLQVDSKVPVYYIEKFPAIAIYYDPVWHYIVPTVVMIFALTLVGMAFRS